jgi:hypothetical protein
MYGTRATYNAPKGVEAHNNNTQITLKPCAGKGARASVASLHDRLIGTQKHITHQIFQK